MIITITMNPSIDFIYFTKQFRLGTMTRFDAPVRYVGGKGVNCGRTSSLLGSTVVLTGFLGGHFGQIIQEMLMKEQRFVLNFLPIEEESRGAVTIMHDQGTQTELVEAGPKIDHAQIKRLMTDIKHLYEKNKVSVITINGSVNNSDPLVYVDLLAYIREKIDPSIPILMDISGKHLEAVLRSNGYKPFFIKPNLQEFSEIIQQRITKKSEIIAHLQNNQLFEGIDIIMVSCGAGGAVVKADGKIWDIRIPEIKIINTTGSGDATVGGFAYALEQEYSLTETLQCAMACGMSNTQQSEVGVVVPSDVKRFMKKITITPL
ncbi:MULTISPECIES: 1-phosphofructokinase family hexose kinase [unclassified Enterococcus]|uniref:1-phosphofructokinase family hexose kinase n=1 Tax=unclassified Enterococcus TaxID=2608891 RepID=UPI0013EC2328|nr:MULTISPECIES: 1-phosphofructokinase family hexose kinase [unclassified Enterococcus]